MTPDVDVPCTFSGKSVGKTSVSIGLSIPLKSITAGKAHEHLTNARCRVTLRADADAKDDVPGQTRMPNAADQLIADGEFGRLSFGKDNVTARVSFELIDTISTKLETLSFQSGRLMAVRTGDASGKFETEQENAKDGQGTLGDGDPEFDN